MLALQLVVLSKCVITCSAGCDGFMMPSEVISNQLGHMLMDFDPLIEVFQAETQRILQVVSKVSRLRGCDRRSSLEHVLHRSASVRVRNPSQVTKSVCKRVK